MTGEDGVSIIHPSYHDGEDGVSIIHPSYHDGEGCRGIIDPEDNIGSTAGPGGSTYLRSDNRFVFETPTSPFLGFPAQLRPKTARFAPRWPQDRMMTPIFVQDRSKIAPRRLQTSS